MLFLHFTDKETETEKMLLQCKGNIHSILPDSRHSNNFFHPSHSTTFCLL